MNLYGFGDGDPVNYADPFGLCPQSMRNDQAKCDAYNQKQVQAAVDVIDAEAQRGNAYAQVPDSTMNVMGVNDPDIANFCGTGTRTGCSDGGGNIVVNADRNPEAISQTLVHEVQHVLHWGTRRGSEDCAKWQSVRYVRAMSPGHRRAATSDSNPAYTSVPNSRRGC